MSGKRGGGDDFSSSGLVTVSEGMTECRHGESGLLHCECQIMDRMGSGCVPTPSSSSRDMTLKTSQRLKESGFGGGLPFLLS